MTRRRPRCATPSWYGTCASSIVREHACARPPGHPPPCMCYCGERPGEGDSASPEIAQLAFHCQALKHAHDRQGGRP